MGYTLDSIKPLFRFKIASRLRFVIVLKLKSSVMKKWKWPDSADSTTIKIHQQLVDNFITFSILVATPANWARTYIFSHVYNMRGRFAQNFIKYSVLLAKVDWDEISCMENTLSYFSGAPMTKMKSFMTLSTVKQRKCSLHQVSMLKYSFSSPLMAIKIS